MGAEQGWHNLLACREPSFLCLSSRGPALLQMETITLSSDCTGGKIRLQEEREGDRAQEYRWSPR